MRLSGKLVFWMTFLIVVLQIAYSTQSPLTRQVRQAPNEDENAQPDVDGRWGGSWWGNRRDPRQQPGRPGRPGRPDRPNQNNNNNNQQQQESTTAAAEVSTAAPTARPDCVRRCPVTPEYNPVCGRVGTTRQGFTNRSRLDCAQQCGLGITFLRMGNC